MEKFRGYISHIMYGGRSVPQSIQQQVVRNYCEKNGLQFLLSATEFEGETKMLKSILKDIDKIKGIIFYSIFLLPRDKVELYSLFHEAYFLKKELHFAAENIAIKTWPKYQSIVDLCSIMDAYENNSLLTESILKEKYA